MTAVEALGRADGGPKAAANLPGTLRAAGRAAGLAVTIGEMVARARAEDAAGSPAPRVFAERTQRAARVILDRHGVIVVPSAPPAGPAIVVTNHASYLDPL